MALSVKLMVVGGEVKTTEIKLKLPAIIGRGKGCTIVLPHALVSRQHCELFERDGLLFARDLGSLNGTFVNSERVEEAPLPPENLLTVGAVTFRAQYESHAELAAPSGAGAKPKASRETETAAIPLSVQPAAKPRPPAPATIVVPPKAAPAGQTPQDPVDIEMDLDLDDATPMQKTASPAPLPDPLPVSPPQASAPPAPAATAAPPASAAPAAKPAPPAEAGAGFGFLEPTDDTEAADEEDDDLQDFLKNLNK